MTGVRVWSVIRSQACAVLLAASALGAQTLRGTLSDARSNALEGIVVQLVDASSHAIATSSSNARGAFTLGATAGGIYRVRALRIGATPWMSESFQLAAGEQRDVRLVPLWTAIRLDTLRVTTSRRCSDPEQNAAAFIVWEQVRASIANTIVSASQPGEATHARDSLTARVLTYERTTDRARQNIRSQNVQVRAGLVGELWKGASTSQLRSNGYVVTQGDTTAAFAPSLEVLLDDAFVEDHCISITARDSALTTLAFEPNERRDRLANINGVVQIDHRTNALKNLKFGYTNVSRERAQRSGGEIEFVQLRDGTSAIERWFLRLPVIAAAPLRQGYAGDSVTLELREKGGELLFAGRGRDTLYSKRLLELSGSVRDSSSGSAVSGAFVEFEGTRSSAVSDSLGRFVVRGLIPGPYTVRVHTGTLDDAGAILERQVTVVASDAPLIVRVPSASQLSLMVCGREVTGGIITGTIFEQENKPVASASVVAEWSGGSTAQGRRITATSDSLGHFRLCGVSKSADILLTATHDGAGARPTNLRLDDKAFANVELVLDEEVAGATLIGAVITGQQSRPVKNAEIVMLEEGKSTVADSLGTFRLGGISAGKHRVLVRRFGFVPVEDTIVFKTRQTVQKRYALNEAVRLDSVKVVAEKTKLGSGFEAFEDRRKLGFGKFFDSDFLLKNEYRQLTDILREVPRLKVRSLKPCNPRSCAFSPPPGMRVAFNDVKNCAMAVILDGVMLAPQGALPEKMLDLRTIPLMSVEAIEIYRGAAETPHEFSGLNVDCGVIVLWTRKAR